MMVISPVNPYIDKAEQIARKCRNHFYQRLPGTFPGDSHFKHHDRNDDGNYSIAEGFEAGFIHLVNLVKFQFCKFILPDRTSGIIHPRPKFSETWQILNPG